VPVFLGDDELAVLAAACERVVSPGAAAAGVADYIDGLLGAFTVDPPRIWSVPATGGPPADQPSAPPADQPSGPPAPASGLDAGRCGWLPLNRWEELAWRTRVEGSQGIPERERLGPVVGWQQRYRSALAVLGPDFAEVGAEEQDRRLAATGDEFRALLFQHACEGLYGGPVHGGNRDGAAWRAIGFPGGRPLDVRDPAAGPARTAGRSEAGPPVGAGPADGSGVDGSGATDGGGGAGHGHDGLGRPTDRGA
jgi:hypothetical protein